MRDVGLSTLKASASNGAAPSRAIRRGTLCLGERTLDALGVKAFARRILSAAPTIHGLIVSIEASRRCGGRQRLALFGIDEELIPELHTNGELVYREMSPAEYKAMRSSQGEGPY